MTSGRSNRPTGGHLDRIAESAVQEAIIPRVAPLPLLPRERPEGEDVSRLTERLARAEARLREIEDRDNMHVVIHRESKPIVIDYAKRSTRSKPKSRANGRRTARRRSRRAGAKKR
jgi:hypothetical protein